MLLIILALLSPIIPPNQPPSIPLDDIACIVAGEASHWDAQVFIATQLIHDHERGVVLHDRWYGWRCGSEQAERAVRLALAYYPLHPRCRFVGSEADAVTWRARGWIDGEADLVFRGPVLAFGCEP